MVIPSRDTLLGSLLVLTLGMSLDGVLGRQVAAASERKRLTIDDVVSMRRLQAVQIAPDGRRIAFVLEQPYDESLSKDPTRTRLWIVATTGGEPRLYTA